MKAIKILTVILLLLSGTFTACKKKTIEPIVISIERQITLVPTVNKASNYYWINPPQITFANNSTGRPNGTPFTANVGDTILVRITKTSQDLTPGCQVFQDGVEQIWISFGPNTTDFSARYVVQP